MFVRMPFSNKSFVSLPDLVRSGLLRYIQHFIEIVGIIHVQKSSRRDKFGYATAYGGGSDSGGGWEI